MRLSAKQFIPWNALIHPHLGERRERTYHDIRLWIRKNSEHTEFWRIQLRVVVRFCLSVASSQLNPVTLRQDLDAMTFRNRVGLA